MCCFEVFSMGNLTALFHRFWDTVLNFKKVQVLFSFIQRLNLQMFFISTSPKRCMFTLFRLLLTGLIIFIKIFLRPTGQPQYIRYRQTDRRQNLVAKSQTSSPLRLELNGWPKNLNEEKQYRTHTFYSIVWFSKMFSVYQCLYRLAKHVYILCLTGSWMSCLLHNRPGKVAISLSN